MARKAIRVHFSEGNAMTPEETHEKISSDATRFAEEYWRNLLSVAPSQNRTDADARLVRQVEVIHEEYGPLGPTFLDAINREQERLQQEFHADPAALRGKLGISLPEPVQPHVEAMTPEEIIEKKYSSTITRLVEDHWRNLLLAQNPIAIKIAERPDFIEILKQVNNTPLGLTLGTAFFKAVTREMTRLSQECNADPLAFRRRLGIPLPEPVQPQVTPEETFEQMYSVEITKLAEDHWRAFLTAAQRQNSELAMEEVVAFDKMLKPIAEKLGSDGPAFLAAVDRARDRLQQEYDVDRVALRRRLGISLPEPMQPRVNYGGSVGGMVVRTAIRATIWESVRALFRAFRCHNGSRKD
jgi:hypothetical protein